MRLVAIVAALTFASVARAQELPTIDSAFPPTLRIGATSFGTRVDQVAITRAGGITWVSIAMGAAHGAVDADLALDVPPGARIFGIGIGRDGQAAWGRARTARHARAAFRGSASSALVEWVATSVGQDHLVIRADQVSSGTRIDLAIEWPGSTTLAVDVESGTVLTIDGQRAVAPARIEIDVGEPPPVHQHVDASTSLIVEPIELAEPGDTGLTPTSVSFSVGAHEIRRVLTIHRAQLRYCYVQVAQRVRDLRGTAVLHFTIDPGGSVSDASVDGDLEQPDVRACLAAQAASWEFPDGDQRVQVNYPITFAPM